MVVRVPLAEYFGQLFEFRVSFDGILHRHIPSYINKQLPAILPFHVVIEEQRRCEELKAILRGDLCHPLGVLALFHRDPVNEVVHFVAAELLNSRTPFLGPLLSIDLLKLNGLAVNLKCAFYLVVQVVNRFAVLAQGLDSEVCFVLRVLVEKEPHEGVQDGRLPCRVVAVDVEVVAVGLKIKVLDTFEVLEL